MYSVLDICIIFQTYVLCFALMGHRRQTDRNQKYHNQDSKRKFDKSKLYTKLLCELIRQAMDDTSVVNRCNHQVLRIE